MTDLPRIAGTFANFKLVKTRSVAVLEIEIPLETADATLSALGGLPKPGAEQWVALAPILAGSAVAHDSLKAAERRPLSMASRVALTCREKSFAEFLGQPRFDQARTTAMSIVSERASIDSERNGYFEPQEAVVEMVRRLCGVESRSEIVPGSEAARRWSTLEADYHHWQRQGEAA